MPRKLKLRAYFLLYTSAPAYIEFKKFLCYENFCWPWHPVFYCGLVSCFLLLFGIPFSVVVHHPIFVIVWTPVFVAVWHPIFGFGMESCFLLLFGIPFLVVVWHPRIRLLLCFGILLSFAFWHPFFCCGFVSRFLLLLDIPLSIVV